MEKNCFLEDRVQDKGGFSYHSFNTVSEVPAGAVSQDTEIKAI